VSAGLCEQIAKVRRKLQRVGKHKIIFLDETHLRLSEAPLNTLVLPGEQPYITAAATASYAPRYDMIASCSGKEQLLPIIYAPKERGAGITLNMLVRFIDDLFAQQLRALDRYPLTLVLDAASIHNEEKIMEALKDRGCGEVTRIIKMPAHSAKRLSPLDNALLHDWKEAVREMGQLKAATIKQHMSQAWELLPARFLRAHYRHCGLMRGQDVYFDCPEPDAHKHSS
jgi:hypothetical protein